MSQNIPPPGQGPEFNDQSSIQGNSEEDLANNPYFARQQATSAPNLDDNAPVLRSSDVQKMNRKALMFLGAIVLILLLLGFWVIRSATNSNDEVEKPSEEQVVVPDLPSAPTVAAPVDPVTQPIEVIQAEQSLPPLPIAEQAENYPPPSSMPTVADNTPRGPTLLERRMGSAESAAASSGANEDDIYQKMISSAVEAQNKAYQQATGQTLAQESVEIPASAKFLHKPDTLLVRGTYLRCVLETRIITDIPGYTSCILTGPVYSINGRRLLLPKGSKLLGFYNKQQSNDVSDRIAVVWDRITTPTGIDVTMSSPGIDNLGGAGHPGDVDHHWPERISSALLISLISDIFKYAGEKYGPSSTIAYPQSGVVVEQPFQSNTARTVQRLADQAVESSANRKPTVSINQGTIVTVYVSKDVDFSRVVASR